ncbi:MAG: hypothetical protein ACE37F_03680 [Nannocystaceae bacterium]|nr:hypothetical protein [bacterium]
MTLNEEGLFTAFLVALLRRNESVRAKFLEWVETSSGLELGDPSDWDVEGEARRAVGNEFGRGDLFVDMLFSNKAKQSEIWFEHKIGAGLGRYGKNREYDQIDKYLDAAHRRSTQQRRVSVLLIAARPLGLGKHQEPSAKHQTTEGVGLVWCGTSGHLFWRDFFGPAKKAVEELAPGLDRDVAVDFIQWWSTLPHMTPVDIPSDWAGLFPREGNKFPRSALQDLWGAELVAAEEYGWRLEAQPYAGNSHTYAVPASDDVRQAMVAALETPEKWQGWASNPRQAFAAETVEVSIAGPGIPSDLSFATGRAGNRQWALAITQDGGIYRNTRARVLIEVGAWSGASAQDRERRLCEAVLSARGVLEKHCKLQLGAEGSTPAPHGV